MAEAPGKAAYQPVALPARPDLTDAAIAAAAEAFRLAISTRRTVRDFRPRPVPREIIESCIRSAGTAPSGANHQPWHFVAVASADLKRQIRVAAEAEEQRFYDGAAGDEWLAALDPIGTGVSKPHLEDAAWLIVIFAQRWGTRPDGTRFKHYYVPESVGIACGFLIVALHQAGLSTLTHTPAPMKFLTDLLGRPAEEKPVMIIAAGHAATGATVPKAAMVKKSLDDILTVLDA